MSRGRSVHRLSYFVDDAWDEFRHSPGPNVLALLTLAATLFLAGGILLGIANLEHQLRLQQDDVRVHVYLDDGIAAAERAALERELAALPGVAGVAWVDQAEAVRRYRAWAGTRAELLDELEHNPLPESLEVTIASGADAELRGEGVVQAAVTRAGVQDVRFDRDWLERLDALLDLARAGGAAVAVIVFAAVVFVMASVLRLAVLARRDEIEIMLLVGATPGFVRGPFLVAGLVQGLVASGLALGAVEGARRAALAWAGSPLVPLELFAGRSLPAGYVLLVIATGVLVSLTAAFFAVRR
jgi:cell division transport system permease protein